MRRTLLKQLVVVMLVFAVSLQTLTALEITKFWLIEEETGDTATMHKLTLPEYTYNEQLKLLFEISDAKLFQNTGNVSWVISFYTNGKLETRLEEQFYTPEFAGERFAHWRVLSIPIPAAPGIQSIKITITDHISGLTASDSVTYFVKDADGKAPFLKPPANKSLEEILTGLGLESVLVTETRNNILLEYDCGEDFDYDTLLYQFLTITIQSAFAHPDSEYIVVISKTGNIPVIRTWAATEEILDFAQGNSAFSAFYNESIHADFSVYKGAIVTITGKSAVHPVQLPEDPEAAAEGNMLLFETFSTNDGGWFTDAEISVSDGKYRMHPANTGRLSFMLYEIPDGEIIVHTLLQEGSSEAGYGLLFRVIDNSNFYYFLIAGLGYFSFGHAVDNTYQAVIPWTQTAAINQDDESENVLKVNLTGDTIRGSINGEEVFSLQDTTFRNGGLGFLTSPNITVSYDNLEVWLDSAPGEEVHDE
ncbi:MAG: hypothetical protein H8D65_03000 [Spirochaetes bacterium]|nr:hypothetical protein [Spirochaetota bacterium]